MANDDADQWVSPLLSRLADLRPDALGNDPAMPEQVMPEQVWERLQAALAEEQQQERVVHLVPRLGRNRSRLLGAMVAAAVLGVIAGLTISQLRPSSGDVVADGRAAAPEAAQSAVAMSAPTAPLAKDAPALQAASVLPVRQVLASGTDYSSADLDSQVTGLMQRTGLRSGQRLEDVPQQAGELTLGGWGFTASMDGLRSCVFALTKSETVPALVVDRAKFDGADVALVLTADATSTMLLERVDIWIVDPKCKSGAPMVIRHLEMLLPR